MQALYGPSTCRTKITKPLGFFPCHHTLMTVVVVMIMIVLTTAVSSSSSSSSSSHHRYNFCRVPAAAAAAFSKYERRNNIVQASSASPSCFHVMPNEEEEAEANMQSNNGRGRKVTSFAWQEERQQRVWLVVGPVSTRRKRQSKVEQTLLANSTML
ncbi:hypothetical protein T08_16600 [Trichinella sp. T8]|nr:hypothetical protein T08_16600 [Trichinella sp. T8]